GVTIRATGYRDGAYSGGLRPALIQPSVSDFIGSPATIWWTCSHFGHSKVRRSTSAEGPGSMRDSIMRPWHLGQRGRSSGSSDGSE
ncbi:MAG TPA: hypothetical protein VK620_03065, partial [Bradyrhizobium sp.]|nr:hypothetical protein [Bradyrhizobium sp.]